MPPDKHHRPRLPRAATLSATAACTSPAHTPRRCHKARLPLLEVGGGIDGQRRRELQEGRRVGDEGVPAGRAPSLGIAAMWGGQGHMHMGVDVDACAYVHVHMHMHMHDCMCAY